MTDAPQPEPTQADYAREDLRWWLARELPRWAGALLVIVPIAIIGPADALYWAMHLADPK